MRISPAQTFLDWHVHQRNDDVCWMIRYPELRQEAVYNKVAMVNSCTCPDPGFVDEIGNDVCICCSGLILRELPQSPPK